MPKGEREREARGARGSCGMEGERDRWDEVRRMLMGCLMRMTEQDAMSA